MSSRYSVLAIGFVLAAGVSFHMSLAAWQAGAQAGVVLIPADNVSAAMENAPVRRFVPGEVVVRRQPTAVLSAAQMTPLGLDATIRTTSGDEVVYRISANTMGVMSVQERAGRTMAAVEAIRKLPGVVYAQPNYLYRIVQTTPNDPGFAQQWHYRGIGLPAVWDTNKGNKSVVVAVIDTGVLPGHPDIAGSPNLLAGFDMISDTFIANDGDGRDSNAADSGDAIAQGECGPGQPPVAQPSSWHGTHVAGTVGVGNTNNKIGVAGINWNAKILPIRVLGKCGGSTTDIVDAIRWAAGLPVPGTPINPAANKARVINMSLGGAQPCLGAGGDPAMQSAINDAVKANVTVVVAAGNEAMDASQASPSGCANVITVAASDYRGHFVSRYSNFGKTVEILAPGGDRQRDDNKDGQPDGVLSMVEGGYAFYNGTSMAAPHVAGVAALLLSCNLKLTPPEVLKRIQGTALPRTKAEGCPAGHCGAGLLNAAVAIGPACGAPTSTK